MWERLDVLVFPETRLRHTSTMVGTRMCMFGGLDITLGFQSSLWCLGFSDFDGSAGNHVLSWEHVSYVTLSDTQCALSLLSLK